MTPEERQRRIIAGCAEVVAERRPDWLVNYQNPGYQLRRLVQQLDCELKSWQRWCQDAEKLLGEAREELNHARAERDSYAEALQLVSPLTRRQIDQGIKAMRGSLQEARDDNA